MRSPRLRSPLARAVVPVLGGIAFFVVFFAGLWVAATVINNRADPGSRIANKVFEVGKVKDIAKAVALGAKCVLTGRATLYGTAAGGTDGAFKAVDFIHTELDKTMAYTGCNTVGELSPDIFFGYGQRNALAM